MMTARSSVWLQGLAAVSVPETLAGGQGIVDLWYYAYDEIDDDALRTAQAALMSTDERSRHDRFLFEADRRMFLAKRALVRTVLSRYASVPPGVWRFGVAAQGKPYVAAPVVRPALHFNLSNTPGLVVCAVSVAHCQVGVDAEGIDAHAVDPQLAEMHFAPEETRALRELPTGERKRRFFAYWALKESHIKARGLGLALNLDQIVFRFDDDSVCAGFGPRLAGDAAHWRFVLMDVGQHHLIGVSVDTGGAPLSLRAARVVPLGGT